MFGVSASGGPHQYLRNLHASNDRAQTALERLSTGKRINHPKDDPAGFMTAEMLRGEIAKFQSELKKIARERSATHLEQGGLSQIEDQLVELKGAIVGAAGGMLSDEERQAFSDQIDGVMQSIGRVRDLYNGLSNQKFDRLDAAAQPINVVSSSSGDLEGAAAAVDSRLDEVTFSAAALAAHEKYDLDMPEELLQDEIAIHSEALSQVEDADFAEETSNLLGAQITAQGSLAALAVDNKTSTEQVKALLDGVRENADAAQAQAGPSQA
jgi:flagellin